MARNADAGPGWRVRKRAAAQASIEDTAVSLALKHGYENVTVEMICAASSVSQRTFFNYFGSKEGVILGASRPAPSEEQTRAFVEHGGRDVLADLVDLVTEMILEHGPDMDLLRARRTLIQETPELMTGERARMGDLEGRLVQIVLARFEHQGRTVHSNPDLEDEARMVVALAFGTMHYAMRKWVASNFTAPRQELMQNTAELIRRITGNNVPGS
jgi:AcrR family transcriptional regulator